MDSFSVRQPSPAQIATPFQLVCPITESNFYSTQILHLKASIENYRIVTLIKSKREEREFHLNWFIDFLKTDKHYRISKK